MIKKLFIIFLFCLFPLTANATDPASWDLLDEDCADTGGWTDDSDGASSLTIDPAGQWKFDSGPDTTDRAAAFQDIGDTPNTFTFEIKAKHDALGSTAEDDIFRLWTSQVDEEIYTYFATDGLFVFDTDSGYTEVGTNLVKSNGSAEFQIWRFLVTFTGTTGDGTVDVYLTDTTYPTATLVGENIPCSWERARTNGKILMHQNGYTNSNRITHLDWIKMATGLYDPTEEEAAVAQVIFIND